MKKNSKKERRKMNIEQVIIHELSNNREKEYILINKFLGDKDINNIDERYIYDLINYDMELFLYFISYVYELKGKEAYYIFFPIFMELNVLWRKSQIVKLSTLIEKRVDQGQLPFVQRAHLLIFLSHLVGHGNYNINIKVNHDLNNSNSNNQVLRHKLYYELTNNWLKNKNQGKNVSTYFKNNKIDSIAIYGMGELGMRLYEEVLETDIKVKYFIDKNIKEISSILDISVVGIEKIKSMEKVDAIIVTPIYHFTIIKNELINIQSHMEILSLEDVINYN